MRTRPLDAETEERFRKELDVLRAQMKTIDKRLVPRLQLKRLENAIQYRREALGMVRRVSYQRRSRGKYRANTIAYRALQKAMRLLLFEHGLVTNRDALERELGRIGASVEGFMAWLSSQLPKGIDLLDYGVTWTIGRKFSTRMFDYQSTEEDAFYKAWALPCLCVVRKVINDDRRIREGTYWQPVSSEIASQADTSGPGESDASVAGVGGREAGVHDADTGGEVPRRDRGAGADTQ